MATNTQKLPPHIKQIVEDYDNSIAREKAQIEYHKAQINFHEAQIKSMELAQSAYVKYQPYQVQFTQIDAPLTRDLIRNFLKGHNNPIRTVDIIDLIYRGKSENEKSALVKTLSVMLNQMANNTQEIEIIKKAGTKGNYYKWIKK